MCRQRRKMAKEQAIREYWAKVPGFYERKGFDSADEFLEHGTCFACGFIYRDPPQRAHIYPHVKGGSGDPDNLHMLCYVCHKDSEHLEGDAYWDWFWERDFLSAALSLACRNGNNFGYLLPLAAASRRRPPI
ncbi:hypothetical protein CWO89_24370 [Bradyrhizobium sp. Leo170]|nr:hypothetical protein CWO89_24370 [Bradyrhizobium sp. Leo170]